MAETPTHYPNCCRHGCGKPSTIHLFTSVSPTGFPPLRHNGEPESAQGSDRADSPIEQGGEVDLGNAVVPQQGAHALHHLRRDAATHEGGSR